LVVINILVIFIAAIFVLYLKDAFPLENELEDWKEATSLGKKEYEEVNGVSRQKKN
jgi:hypothetical protein